MISGHATPTGTRQLAEQFSNLTFNPLGKTDLLVSAAGFGGYRIDAGVTAHEAALNQALTNGINLIDTSANYADGGSEQLVGEVIANLIESGRIARAQLVVVSKGGYLQGSNYVLNQQRKTDGNPFKEVVEYAEGLEHCIHPDFLDDQIGRSLARLGLDTLDGYLLHNPEYYLGWAHKQGVDTTRAQAEYYRRIDSAFRHLESEVQKGRIRFYGISSNTFPATTHNPEFTSLQQIWQIAEAIDREHHFRVIQFPFNLFEQGAALEKNQPNNRTLLEGAEQKRLGLLVNRPLNAFAGNRMIRLADIDVRRRLDDKAIIDSIKELAHSETQLWRHILPGIEAIPGGLRIRIKEQGCFAETIKHHWRSFGSYERWRQVKDGIFLPRMQAVMDFLLPHADNHPQLADWIPAHEKAFDRALRAVASIYADEALAMERKIGAAIAQVNEAWAKPDTLSQKAIRALASTPGVSSVLVGMRKTTYVSDVLAGIAGPISPADRKESWNHLRQGLRDLFPS